MNCCFPLSVSLSLPLKSIKQMSLLSFSCYFDVVLGGCQHHSSLLSILTTLCLSFTTPYAKVVPSLLLLFKTSLLKLKDPELVIRQYKVSLIRKKNRGSK